MLVIRVISVIGAVVMAAAIAVGFVTGDFSLEGGEILGLAWGRVTLIDLYVGLTLFGAWVAFRERSWVTTILWWLLLVGLGNLAASLYLAIAAFKSSDLRELMLGPRR